MQALMQGIDPGGLMQEDRCRRWCRGVGSEEEWVVQMQLPALHRKLTM